MADLKSKKILMIVPAYNEALNISRVVKALKEKHPSFCVLVVDDCSVDNTARVAGMAGAEVVSLAFNLGIGGAVQTGFQYAFKHDFDAAVQFDGDGQHDADCIADILGPVLAGRLDICIGSRFLSRSGAFKSSFLRRIGIRFFAALISCIIRQKLTDPTSGNRAFSRKMISLFAKDYPVDFPEPEGIVIAKHHHASIGEAAVVMHARKAGASSISFLKSGYYMFKVTLAVILAVLKKRRDIP